MGALGMGAPCGVPRGDSFMGEQFPMRASSVQAPLAWELDRARRRARDDLEDIRRDSRSALNRLLSIQEDAAFVNDVIHQMLPHLPLVGNERCGTWYIYPRNEVEDSRRRGLLGLRRRANCVTEPRPGVTSGRGWQAVSLNQLQRCPPAQRHKDSVYFKSTDGHTGVWDFSLRRSNLHLLDTVAKHGGQGWVHFSFFSFSPSPSKIRTKMHYSGLDAPREADARLAFQDNTDMVRDRQPSRKILRLPSEQGDTAPCHAQIAARIDGFAETLLVGYVVFLGWGSAKPAKSTMTPPPPARGGYSGSGIQAPEAAAPDLVYAEVENFCGHSAVASTAVPAGAERRGAYLYVQGAADDHELWSHVCFTDLCARARGFPFNRCGAARAALFWSHKDEMLSGTAAACEAAVRRIVASARESRNDGKAGREFDRDGFKWIGDTGIAVGSKASGWFYFFSVFGISPGFFRFLGAAHFDAVINCCAEFEYPENASERRRDAYLNLRIPEGKKGQVRFGDAIGPALEFLRRQLAGGGSPR
ncbi:MAG: hypothetical protein BJ554DRAFT_1743, partial [Olpidium bornovanus]